jgi:anhydro-N-acetylmuramic acid kinase
MHELYIGLMSGTSADGIDAALVDFSTTQPRLIASHFSPYAPELRKRIHALPSLTQQVVQALGVLDSQIGKAFGDAANALLANHNVSADAICGIGSHGQTIYHFPHPPDPYTLQIGDPNIIAAMTGITTVADFRRRDMAHGGQGAPLVPAFHHHVLLSQTNRAIVNIGGIANVSLLSQDQQPLLGFDTGPGNVLLDVWIGLHRQQSHDEKGAWGASGQVDVKLLHLFLTDAYFALPAPKSTGREYFNLEWLTRYLTHYGKSIAAVDVQATLTALTAHSILQAVQKYFVAGEILICGGGVHNDFLIESLRTMSEPHFTVDSTQKYGVAPDWMEAMAFAWLAKQTLARKPGNLPSVTGARQQAVLGGVYYA